MKIEQANSGTLLYESLQKFVVQHRLLYSSYNWQCAFPDSKLVNCVILNKNNDVIGCFVYYRFKKAILNFIITPPFTPNIGLFYLNPSESVVGQNTFNKEIATLLADYFTGIGADYLEISLPGTFKDVQPFVWKGYMVTPRFSYLLALDRSTEELWANLSSEKRKSINKANKDGIEIFEANDYKVVYNLVVKSLSRNSVHKNDAALRYILLEYAKQGNHICYIAKNKDKTIATVFCIIEGHTAVYLFGGYDSEGSHHGAGVACMWQCLLKAKEINLNYFDFEGSMNKNIERYFREFGGELVQFPVVLKTSGIAKPLIAIKNRKT